jgi:putative hydrolase of the HAD superfamily
LYKAILFDLGGVLIKLVGVPRMMELMKQRFSVPGLWEKWLASPAIRLFESGKSTVEEFGEQIVAEFEIDILPSRYLEEFAKWPAGKYPGVNALLASVKKCAPIGCLSNTNVLHWNRMVSEMDFIHLFDYTFPSHLTGCLKPDIDAYVHAAKQMGIRPDEALFFDDNRINVEGAQKAGMDAIEVHGVAEAQAHLASIGLI